MEFCLRSISAFGILTVALGLQSCKVVEKEAENQKGLAVAALNNGGEVAWTNTQRALADSARDVAVGGKGVVYNVGTFIPGNADLVGWVRKFTPHNGPNQWTSLERRATAVAVDPAGNPWALCQRDNPGLSQPRLSRMDANGNWSTYPGPTCPVAQDISISSSGDVFVVCGPADDGAPANGGIYQWSANAENPTQNTEWVLVGEGRRIAASYADYPWMVKAAGDIYRRDPETTNWVLVPCDPADDIAIGRDGEVWVTLRTLGPTGNLASKAAGSSQFVTRYGVARRIAAQDTDPFITSHVGQFGTGLIGGDVLYWARYFRFESSFESATDFRYFFLDESPPGAVMDDYVDATYLQQNNVPTTPRHGQRVHGAAILSDIDQNLDGVCSICPVKGSNLCGIRHRAYPTMQFQNLSGGPATFTKPTLVTLWVYLNFNLGPSVHYGEELVEHGQGVHRWGWNDDADWFSFATFSPDQSSAWNQVIALSIDPDGKISVGQSIVGQNGIVTTNTHPNPTVLFPKSQWVRLDIYLNQAASAAQRKVKVWQNGVLVNESNVPLIANTIKQAHFGLYASAKVASGYSLNDRLRMMEVSGDTEANSFVQSPW